MYLKIKGVEETKGQNRTLDAAPLALFSVGGL
jgi:hypothetical protein